MKEQVFGKADVPFPRVKDVAGVLTQQERETLMHHLEDLERYIPPVALCIYLTNHGQSQEFRSHAHWILNHARIHTPSFGPREAKRAIEDAELRELTPGEAVKREHEEPEEGGLARAWHWLRNQYRERFSKCPPPVRHEWMLILVVDVQLKMACFSWGYMLDPYINPDKINSCITSARLQFRERARVAALELVMNRAVKQLAAAGRRINKDIMKGKRITSPLLAGVLGLSLLTAAPVCWAKPAPKPTPKPAPVPTAPAAMEDDMEAVDDEEELADDTEVDDTIPAPSAPSPTPKQAAATVDPQRGNAATYTTSPNWSKEDYKRLMTGELTACYRTLLPEGKVYTPPARRGKPKSDESDTKVLRRYSQEYHRPSAARLSDPQGLLSDAERHDVEFVLNELNANAPFHIYAAVFKAGQEIPQEINATSLTTAATRPDEHAAMILYSIGDTPSVQIGYREIEPTDDQRRTWLLDTQVAAAQAGGGVNGLLASLRSVKRHITPIAKDFKPLTASVGTKLPLIPLEFDDKKEAKEPSMRDKLKKWMAEPENKTSMITFGLTFLGVAGLSLWIFLRRRVVRLLDSTPDIRLSSPYGAGVSRYVRYLDGKEASKDSPLF